jgi:hypothetical protein
MLREAFGKYFLSQTVVFEWHSHFKAGQVSVEDECSGWPNTTKITENVEKIREFIHEDCCRTIHELAHTGEMSYGVYQEILTENLNMHHTAPSSQCSPPHTLKPHSLWLTTTWLSFPILPTCQTYPPVISLCFQNWKRNWRDDVLKQCLTSAGNQKWYSTALRKMTSTMLLKHEKKTVGSWYMFPRRRTAETE